MEGKVGYDGETDKLDSRVRGNDNDESFAEGQAWGIN
jgi:hypothetical protein